MIFDLNNKVQQLVGKGISVEDAISLIDLQATKGMTAIKHGDMEIRRLLKSNLFDIDLTENFNKLTAAGLSQKEALNIYAQRFSIWFPQVKGACLTMKYCNIGLLDEGKRIEIN